MRILSIVLGSVDVECPKCFSRFHHQYLPFHMTVRDEMKNSTVVQIALIPSSQDQDSDLLDQIFGFEPESHASVSCPHCGSLVSYFSDLEFHNCSGEF